MESCNHIISDKAAFSTNFEEQIAGILNDYTAPVEFHKSLADYTPSPLYKLSALANKLGTGEIYLKNEAERFGIGAIKMLGASYAIHKMITSGTDPESFCAATDGNHGRSVAWSASRYGRKAYIFVPEYTVESRIRLIEDEGGIVFKIHGNYDHAVRAAFRFSDETHSRIIQDFVFKDYREIPATITAGYYTQMKEVEDQTCNFIEGIDLIIIQCGNGCWPSAVVNFVRNHPKLGNAKIVCVEPLAAGCMLESIKAGKPVTIAKKQNTIMAGLNCGTPSALAFEIMRSGVDAFLSIPDNYAIEAMKMLYHPLRGDSVIKAGESGAAGLAGLLALMSAPELQELKRLLCVNLTTRVLIFNTEGITDQNFFDNFIA